MNTASGTLTLNDIRRSFPTPTGPLEVLKGITLHAEPGQTVALVGPSGSGKSTLLNIIGSLDKPTSGSIRLGSIDVGALQGTRISEYRSRHVGFVFQDHHLMPQLSALENVLLPTLSARHQTPDATVRAKQLLETLGLADRTDSFPAKLSGGERQRVALARAIINNPQLLLCDEPTGNLDHDTGRAAVKLVLNLAASHNVTVIMVTHNLELAGLFARCLQLHDGRIIESSSSSRPVL
jgi:lipoprotein-releasing system ATP-binding protein